MATFEDYDPQAPPLQEHSRQNFDLSYVLGIAKRRALYFAIPFLLVLMAGVAVIKTQRPIYRAEGEILVEAPSIPPDLVHPTITELPGERFEVIKQRILANGNLIRLVNKYNLFSDPHQSAAPSFRLIDAMRKRVLLTPVPLEMAPPGSSTTAFTVSFDYEVPSVALKVANDLVQQILNQDTSRRTTNAADTAKFLAQEVNRLRQEHDAVVAQIEAIKDRPPDKTQAVSEETKAQMKSLAALEEELVQKSTIYSDGYPIIKALKRKIAALKSTIASQPQSIAAADSPDKPSIRTQVLEQQALNIQKDLDSANQKLTAALLGESMEKNQQAEHLELISAPDLPHDPVRPKKLKWAAVALAFASAIGIGCAFAAEMLDGSIHRASELAAIVDPRLIVTLPYVATPGEQFRRRRNFALLCMLLIAVLAAGIGVAVAKGVSIDFVRWLGIFMHPQQ